ncbi:MAG: Ectoine/proline transporter ProP [Holosporales bacterium]
MLVYGGTFLEFFEFVLFATLFPILSQSLTIHYAPQDHATLQFILFALGFVARPFGAILLLKHGDTHNRRNILIFSVVGMAFSTMLMGCAPIYVAPLYSILYIGSIRLLQGIFTGIELSSATIYIYEQTQKEKRHTVAIRMGLAATLGSSLAYFVAALCQINFLQEISFWRAAFLLSGFAGLWIGGLRLTRLPQEYIKKSNEFNEKISINFNMIFAICVIALSYVPFYYLSTFLNIYPVILGTYSPALPFLINAFTFLCYSGIIAFLTRITIPKKVIQFSFFAFIILVVPLSYVIFEWSHFYKIPALLCLIAISQIIVCGTIGYIPGIFKKNQRLRSYTLAQTFAASCFGGTTPLICHMIAQSTGSKWLAGTYIAVFVGIAYLCFLKLFSQKIK